MPIVSHFAAKSKGEQNMDLYVASSPKKAPPSGNHIPVWAACCTGERLGVCDHTPQSGLLMVIYGSSVSDPALMARDILRQCLSGQHSGIILDFPPNRSELIPLVKELGILCRKYSIPLFLPESYAPYGDAFVIVSTTLVGGNLREKLKDAVSRYGAQRIMLDLERTCRDYLLPSPTGNGRCLSQETFRRLSTGCTRYFSPDQCTRYFTYRNGMESHYIVYDDADTLRKKIAMAEELGIQKALVVYSEVEDLWPL